MDQKTFDALLDRFLSEDVSRKEAERVLHSLEDDNMRRQWLAAIEGLLENKQLHGLSDPARRDAIRMAILGKKSSAPVKKVRLLRRYIPYAAAAVIIAAIALVLYKPGRPGKELLAQQPQDASQVLPGGNKAMLILSDGRRITLDTADNGTIASQGNVQVIKLDSGQLAYNPSDAVGKGKAIGYSTLVTPKGGQFRITLPDGSKVWLNAASTLRFPNAFAGGEREVQLTGEAYFEVAKNPAMPFKVKVNDMAVQVLGTHFNVMAYPDEPGIRTTLLEGAVKVQHGESAVQLEPGQQANLSLSGKMTTKNDVDVEEVVAWKNGYFHFNRESLQGVMRQIGRWYDAEIAYEGEIAPRQFGGKIERSSSVTEVMKILELSRVHYRIEGKKIIVMP
ncbi:FecR family protein [Chitinophaga sp. GCM10012297]|uniref:FecR domain-containing protein n=1 Tax=Chitinophaga chungangae TaxID=2821488 RepID=A0ABS3YH38_9BACT|nr:FecR domain-containing protein [Chitinophaga chungangae]MBO9154005.1 FecR domain-containing protein [Chitinophaga chungangae]